MQGVFRKGEILQVVRSKGKMAKPIEATPTLRGKDAERLINNMKKTENREPTEKEKEMARKITEMVDD